MEKKRFELELRKAINDNMAEAYDKSSREVKINIPIISLIKILEEKNV